MLATITFSAEEHRAGTPNRGNVDSAATALRANGCVLLHHVLAPELVGHLCEAHFARHPGLAQGRPPSASGKVGNQRFQTPLDLSPPFDPPALYANPLVLPILEAVLGNDLVIGACGTVTSLPGAGDQHCHRDGSPLFNEAVNRMSPAHALDFFVPLVEFNATTGTTRLYPRTHNAPDSALAQTPPVDPIIPVGSCVLMDYRLFHQGLANRSDRARPLLYFVFQKPWFKDYRNHSAVPFFRLPDSGYAAMPPEHRRLFAWTEHYRAGLY